MKRTVSAWAVPYWREAACLVVAMLLTHVSALRAQTFTTLRSFDLADGAQPMAGLIQAANGQIYGTTTTGGTAGEGTIIKIGAGGTLITLYNFCLESGCQDGSGPVAGLVQGSSGEFYGTTSAGGNSCPFSCGTVFSITTGGELTTLYRFCAQSGCLDGQYPASALVQGSNNVLYGTTLSGGALAAGTIFKITPGGALTTLHSFCSAVGDCPDGSAPRPAALVVGADGNLYGTTKSGGRANPACNANDGCGTVFQITPGGTLTTIYSFCSVGASCVDGIGPVGALAFGSDGNLYGTTQAGGANPVNHGSGGAGTVFKLTKGGALATLYNFCSRSGCTDGTGPEGGLTLGSDGNLYGTTGAGGAHCAPGGCGTIFKITPGGTFTTLYNFCPNYGVSGCKDGYAPDAALVQGTNGTFYGTTPNGGAYGSTGFGTIFSLSVGLAPFVETQTTLGKAGSAVKILGTDLTGATNVSFNGTPAVFTVTSASLITTTVPAGATSGTVQVVTPGGTLSSNVPFHVVQ
jgi:uncharacterized repeat protein (TIGR03803 family)